jgi:hypothetical protein
MSGSTGVSDEQIAEWRKLKSHGMVSAVGEYTPDEFWLALDEIERLRALRAPAITEGDSPRTDALRAKHKSGVGNSFYGEMHQHAETLERELSLRAPASGDAPCGCEFSDAGELEQMCMAHWRYAFVTINAGKHPPYIPGLPPVTLNAALAASRGD